MCYFLRPHLFTKRILERMDGEWKEVFSLNFRATFEGNIKVDFLMT